MRRSIAILLLMCVSLGCAYGQKIRKAYVTHRQENGTLYFIVPQEIFSNNTEGALSMDFTRLSSVDTVRLSYTMQSSELTPTDSISFVSDSRTMTFPAEKIYIRPAKKSGWEHRYLVLMPFGDMEALFAEPLSPLLVTYSGGTAHEFIAKKNKWDKYSADLRTIMSVMSINH